MNDENDELWEYSELLRQNVRSMVERPAEVEIRETKTPYGYDFKIVCNPDDVGLVVGVDGRTISSLREVFRVIGKLDNNKITLDIDQSCKRVRSVA